MQRIFLVSALALALAAALALTGCQTTSMTLAEPPAAMEKPAGKVPTAVLMPWYTANHDQAKTAYDVLTNCLEERHIFDFVPREQAQEAVTKAGVDVERMFGPDDAEYAAVAEQAGADFALWGSFTIVNNLTLAGWRKDVTSIVYLHRADGSGVQNWRANTGGTFTDLNEATKAEVMITGTMNHMCARIIETMR